MNLLRLLSLAFVCGTAFAQTATLSSDTSTLSPSGGQVVLTATASYDGEPGALGWMIELPADWQLVSVGGPNTPDIKPDAGVSGTLEFAFVQVPAQTARFTVLVRYPANARTTSARSTVLIRAGGRLNTVNPAPVELQGVSGTAKGSG